MHNCKANRESLIALACNQAQSDQTRPLPAELEACAACREEYAALLNVLRVAAQVKESALPAESFWPGYHARLRQNLEAGGLGVPPVNDAPAARAAMWLGNLFMRSVRLPIPLVAALLVFLGVSLVFALNARRSIGAPPPVIVTKTVEVPVIKEITRDKIVTQVVYRDRNLRQTFKARANEIARRNEPAAEPPISLVGFKPASDVKLTIIKGSGRDEK